MNVREAVVVSQALDDRLGPLAPKHAGQGRVDALLSSREQLPMVAVPAALRDRVMVRVMENGGATVARGSSVARGVARWATMAACLAAGAGGMWMMARPRTQPVMTAPFAQDTSRAGGASEETPARMDLAAIFRLPERSQPAIEASVEAPLLHEAQLIREDSQAGVEMVLSRLPLGSATRR
jgi:hypothetical protein